MQSYVYNWGCLCGYSNLFVSMKAQSSDDDGPLKEEEAVKKLQMQRAEYLTVEDFGLDVNEDCSDPSDME